MKKILLVLSLCIFLCLNCSVVFAEDKVIDVKWSCDYENMNLIVDIQSGVPYIQQVTMLIYDDNLPEKNFYNFSHIKEVTVKGNANERVVFPITNDFTSVNNKYIIKLQGSGYRWAGSKAEIPVWIIPQNKIDGTDGVLYDLNTVDVNNIETSINAVDKTLQLSVPDNVEKDTLLEYFVLSRTNDYEDGKFQNLNDVRDSWNAASVISYLIKDDVNKPTLISMTEENIESFNIDLQDEDYIDNKEDIYGLLIDYAKENKQDIVGIKAINKLFKDYQIIACINNSTPEDMFGYISKYYNDFDKDISYYNKYVALSKESRDIVNRQISKIAYKSIAVLATTFVDAVETVYKNNSSDSSNTGSAGGGGSSGSGGSSGGSSDRVISSPNDAVVITPGTGEPVAVESKFDFIDCQPSHWAYSYVEQLRAKGVVSGYGSGEFYPDKSVSREEFIKMLVSALGLYDSAAQCSYNDIDINGWAYKYVSSANNLGIVNGISENLFGAGLSVTREDVAVMIYRTIEKLGKSAIIDASYNESSFNDFDKVSSYAQAGVMALSEYQIINGFEDGTFKPKNYLTRAQAAKIIFMVCKLVG